MSKSLPVHELFYTFQGEGDHAGKPAFFIRLYGCPVHCPWCDSAGTWHKDYLPSHIRKMDVAELTQSVLEAGAPTVVVTGGEPAIHDLTVLVDALQAVGAKVHLETSGAFPIRGNFDWITLSPKRWKLPIRETLAAANEFKIIVEAPGDIPFYTELILDRRRFVGLTSIWLHPEWSKREDSQVLEAITEAVKTHEFPYRAGWQLHKLYRADSFDARAAVAVPLGGDPARGSSI